MEQPVQDNQPAQAPATRAAWVDEACEKIYRRIRERIDNGSLITVPDVPDDVIRRFRAEGVELKQCESKIFWEWNTIQ